MKLHGILSHRRLSQEALTTGRRSQTWMHVPCLFQEPDMAACELATAELPAPWSDKECQVWCCCYNTKSRLKKVNSWDPEVAEFIWAEWIELQWGWEEGETGKLWGVRGLRATLKNWMVQYSVFIEERWQTLRRQHIKYKSGWSIFWTKLSFSTSRQKALVRKH